MTVDTRATEEEFDDTGSGHVDTESEDEDPEATRRYWEVKRKKEGAHQVRDVCAVMRDASVMRDVNC
jgi:hypothetical protein